MNEELTQTQCREILADAIGDTMPDTARRLKDGAGISQDEAMPLRLAFRAMHSAARAMIPGPIPMRLRCPSCNAVHVDEGDFATKPHHTHACQKCGEVWRPAVVATVGVQFLPGFKNST